MAATRGAYIFTTFITFLLLLISIALAKDHAHGSSYLMRGSSVSIEDSTTTILVSPNSTFACGFYRVATNAFTFSIWFNGSAAKTVAWPSSTTTARPSGAPTRPRLVPAMQSFSTTATLSSWINMI
jgi:hypothetical protein